MYMGLLHELLELPTIENSINNSKLPYTLLNKPQATVLNFVKFRTRNSNSTQAIVGASRV